MSDIPIIKIPKMRSSGDDWCKHYAGFFNPGLSTGKKTHCDAGVEYDSVKAKVDFNTQRFHESTPYLHHEAHPCFRHQAHLTGGCAKCQYYTELELKARHDEVTKDIQKIAIARKEIVIDLYRRFHDHDNTVFVLDPKNEHRWTKPQDNYFTGSGNMKCPVCETGNLRYSRAAYNGHIHAQCSTKGCVAWME